MTARITQPEINIREELNKNKQTYGIKGKQLLEADTVNEVRSLIGAGRKNLLINGDFNIWQRDTTFTLPTTGKYTADRFFAARSSSVGAYTVNQVTGDISTYAIKLQRDSGDTLTNFIGLTYVIETIDVVKLRGKSLTGTIRLKKGKDLILPTNGIRFTLSQTSVDDQTFVRASHGSISSANSDFEAYALGINLTDEFVDYTFNFGNIASVTNTISLRIGWTPEVGTAGTDDSITIDRMQLEVGTEGTEFDEVPINSEIELCQRYYQKSYDLETDLGTITNNGVVREHAVRNHATNTIGDRFKTRMRVIPTITIYSPSTGTSGMVYNDGDKSGTPGYIAESGIPYTAITGGTTAFYASYHYTADAEI